jgi:hypothetical protein
MIGAQHVRRIEEFTCAAAIAVALVLVQHVLQ